MLRNVEGIYFIWVSVNEENVWGILWVAWSFTRNLKLPKLHENLAILPEIEIFFLRRNP